MAENEGVGGVRWDGRNCQKGAGGGGVTESEDIEDADGVRLGRRSCVATPAFVKTWGQLPTRPDGLLRTVGRISLNES